MSARDELALDIFLADNGNIPEETLLMDWADAPDQHRPYAQNIADGLIAKGYRKPRGIITADEIENMPGGSVIIGPDWHSEVYAYTGMSLWYSPGSNVPWDARELEARGPFIVLYVPEVEAAR